MKRFTFFAALAAFFSNVAHADAPSLEDRAQFLDTITSIAAGADRHDWPRVRSAFANKVTLDYTSLWGGDIQTIPADEVIKQWSAFLPGFDRTHHLVTNYTVIDFTPLSATLEADFQATHRIENQYWTLLGRYTYRFEKEDEQWRVNALTMTWTHEHGDRGLVGLAAKNAK